MKEVVNQLRWALPMWFVGLLTNWWPDNRCTLRLRGALARPFIGRCGGNFQLGSGVTLLNPATLSVGNDVYIAHGSWLNAMGGLHLGDEVIVSPYVVMSSLQHVFKDASVRFGGSNAAPISVGRGSWIASHSTITAGVNIGAGCLIAANSAVTKDVPDGMMAGGVPAKVIRPNSDGNAQFVDRADRNRLAQDFDNDGDSS